MKKIVVTQPGNRIDKYLAGEITESRAYLSKLIDANFILVNNEPVKTSYIVKDGDEITILDGFKEEISLNPVQMDIDVLYEDEDIIVINKPSGLVVHPGSGNKENTLVHGLLYYTQSLSDINGEERPGIVHRIDKDTSGVLLVAKNNTVHQILADDFKHHEKVKKEYLALVEGIVEHKNGIIDAPIGRDLKDRKRMCVTATNSKDSVTHFHVLERFKELTLLNIEILTGRTHQIRVHMKYIGHSVFNDPVYSHKSEGDFGQYLHSWRLTIQHPRTKQEMTFEAPLPKEFEEKLKELQNEIL